MTSILGLKCEEGLEGVVIVSDFCGIQTKLVYDGPNNARIERRKTSSKKLYMDSKGEIVIGHSGQTNLYRYSQFLSEILRDSSPMKKAIERTHHLKKLEEVNTQISQSSQEPNPPLIKLLIATRYDNAPKLFQCNEDGYISEEVPTVLLGSGAGLMHEYLTGNRRVIPSRLSISDGIKLGFKCLQEAFRDPFTGGTDLVIVTRKRIDELGKGIRDAIKYARRSAIEGVVNHYIEGGITDALQVTSQIASY